MTTKPHDPENRTTPRRRVLKGGKITYGNFLYVVDCTIRDMTAIGAKLRVGKDEKVPDTFFLISYPEAEICAAEVRWRRGLDIGIEFTGPPQAIATSTDPRHTRFRFG